jgi:predicted permease
MDVASAALIILVVGGSVAVIVLAGVVLARSRRAETVRLFGRVVRRPVLWASAAVCCGVAGLLFEAREFMSRSWQEPTRNLLGVLMLAFFFLRFAHFLSQWNAQRCQR